MATVVDDNSGLFQWNGQWASNNTADAAISQYYDSSEPPSSDRDGVLPPKLNSTSHYSETNGANCLIAWTGTDIAVYGARRSNHGIYGISVDDASPSYFSGFASPDEFQQVLYSTSGLSQGDHQIVISNANSQNTAQYPNYIYVDVDFVAVTGTLRDANNLGAATSTSSSTKQSSPSSASPSSSNSPAAAADTTSSSSPSSSSASAASIASASAIPVSSSSSASSTTGSAASVSPSAIAAAVATASGSSSGTVATATGQIQISGVGEYSAAQSSAVSASGSTAVTAITTGTPNTGDGGSEGNAAASEDSSSTTTHKTTVIAISSSVIAIAIATIAAIGTIWYVRRRRRLRLLEDDESDRDYIVPQSSWRQL